MKNHVDENNYPLFDGVLNLKQKPMKTAMQELIEWLEQNEIYYNKELILKLKETLQKEKEQFDDMFEEGFESAYQHFVNGEDFVEFEEYYNQTYNQNK
jgi:hypothetical protein